MTRSPSLTANPVNQYTLAGQEPFAYDPNGNLTQMGVHWSASYDGANRLVQAQAQGNTMTVAYDAFHRPVTRTSNGQTRYMVWDGWRLAEEREADTTLSALYIHGQGPDEILSRTDAQGATLCYHHDGLGNTLALTDASGQVVERYSYDAFGKVSIFDAAFNPLPSSSVHNRFLFTGREWIAELNLYDYRNRVYSAELGRFLQTDPIRFKAGDLNLYRYCGNDSVNKMDPEGLHCRDCHAEFESCINEAEASYRNAIDRINQLIKDVWAKADSAVSNAVNSACGGMTGPAYVACSVSVSAATGSVVYPIATIAALVLEQHKLTEGKTYAAKLRNCFTALHNCISTYSQ